MMSGKSQEQVCPHCSKSFVRIGSHKCKMAQTPTHDTNQCKAEEAFDSDAQATMAAPPAQFSMNAQFEKESSPPADGMEQCATCKKRFKQLSKHKCKVAQSDQHTDAGRTSWSEEHVVSETGAKEDLAHDGQSQCPSCKQYFKQISRHKCKVVRPVNIEGACKSEEQVVRDALGAKGKVFEQEQFSTAADGKSQCPSCKEYFKQLSKHKCKDKQLPGAEEVCKSEGEVVRDAGAKDEVVDNADDGQSPCPSCKQLSKYKCSVVQSDQHTDAEEESASQEPKAPVQANTTSKRHRQPVKRRMAEEASISTDVQDTRCPRRAMHVVVCVGENLIVWGGFQAYADKDCYKGRPSSDVWLYQADMDFWTRRKCAGPHPPSASGASGVLVRPYWYIIGGWTDQGYTDHVYRLHVTTLEWESVKTSSPTLIPRGGFTSWAHNDRIYCFGGFGPDVKSTGLHQYGDWVENKESSLKEGWNNQLLVLDVKTQQWSNPPCKGIAPLPRSGHPAAVLGDKVYICGGVCSGEAMIDLNCLNLTAMTWSGEQTTKGPVPERRRYHSLTAVGRDRLLLFGGFGPGYRPLEDLWLLSTATMEWTLVKELTGHPRYCHTACCTQSGNVLVFGGGEDSDRSRKGFSRCSDQILEIQIKPLESHPSKYKGVVDISRELRDIAGALHDLPHLPSLHDIQLPEKWPDLSNHDPKCVDVVTVAKHDTAMRQHFDTASSGKHRTVYRMQQVKRGLFLLINNESFAQARREKGWDIGDRAGTAVDAAALCELFTQLGFETHRKDDCTAEDMRRELRAMLSRDHTVYDCFACAILSHGERGAILGTDGQPFSLYGTNSSSKEVMTDSLTDIVTQSGCKSLAGKPKLFFIQACQGESADIGVDQDDTAVKTSDVTDDNVTDEAKDSGEMPQGEEIMDVTGETHLALEGLMEGLEVADCRRLPAGADLFIAEATTAGFISIRNTVHGTWFMQALVYVFSRFAHMLDIAELMTAVNNLVSMSETRRGGFKQQSWIKSALNKKLYFFPGFHQPR